MKFIRSILFKIGEVQFYLLFGLVYIFMMPLMKILSRKNIKIIDRTKWRKWSLDSNNLQDLQRQY